MTWPDRIPPFANGGIRSSHVRLRQNCSVEISMEELLDACTAGYLTRVKALLDRGCSPNGTGERRGTPLTVSARKGHHDVVSLLIASGADVDKK